jgi:hypothetical protein
MQSNKKSPNFIVGCFKIRIYIMSNVISGIAVTDGILDLLVEDIVVLLWQPYQ